MSTILPRSSPKCSTCFERQTTRETPVRGTVPFADNRSGGMSDATGPETFEGNLKLDYWRLGYGLVTCLKAGALVALGYALAV